MTTIKKTRFAYPNVKLTKGTFIGCGRYVASEDDPGEGYDLAAPKITKTITRVRMAASVLAPESSDITRDIYEIKDDPRAKYVGDSQALAYLLALISRSRDIRSDMAGHDLWCTGSIDIADGKRPILDAVDFEGFNIKLNAFLFEQERDTLFVVPAPIIQPMHEALFKEHDVRVISLTQASDLSADENFRGKTVLLVPPFSLDVLLEALFETPEEKELPLGPNPYKGLEAFQEADAARFFGREKLTQDIWERFQGLHQTPSDGSARLRFLAILGPSGSGKSSAARAGLIPLLRVNRFHAEVFTPGAHPLEKLAGILARMVTNDPAPVAKTREFVGEMAQANRKGKRDGLRRIAEMLPLPRSTHSPTEGGQGGVALLVDQFEEIYALCEDAKERRHFAENLLFAAADKSCGVSVVITLRSDFLGQTQSHSDLNHVIAEQAVIVPAMNKEELWLAIAEPARLAGRSLDTGTVSLLIAETEGHEGALPLLEFALTRIWEGMTQGAEAAETLKQIGGVGGALAGEAQRLYDRLSDGDKRIARRAFLRLVRLGEGTRDTRRRVSLCELVAHKEAPDHVRKIVHEFSKPGARLITLSADEQEREIAEVTHEALFGHWETLKGWLDQGRDDLRFHHRLAAAAGHWEKQKRQAGLLWRSPDLDVLRGFHRENAEDMTELQVGFFEASEREARRQKRRIWLFPISFMLLMSFFWGWTSLFKTLRLHVDDKALDWAFVKSKVAILWDSKTGGSVVSFKGHEDYIQTVEFSPDGQQIITASSDNTARLWDVRSGKQIAILQHDKIHRATFNLNGQQIITTGGGNTAIWDSETRKQVAMFEGNYRCVFDKDEHEQQVHQIMTNNKNNTMLWDTETGKLITIFKGVESAFSYNRNRLITEVPWSVMLWDIKSGKLIAVYKGNGAKFSPDGRYVITSDEGNAWILRGIFNATNESH